MRPLWKDVFIAVWLGMILPGIVLNGIVFKQRQQSVQNLQIMQIQSVQTGGHSVRLRDQDGTCTNIDLDTYITGVLLAEIPAAFRQEALQAQSVAARTYAWKAFTTGGKHKDGSVCADSACCQGYLREEEYLGRGGTAEDLEKVRKAVQSTSSMVLTYEGALIEATYFSSAGGSTESAQAVWGADYPYLQSVSSPEEVSVVSVNFPVEDFLKLLSIDTKANVTDWIGTATYTDGGGVATIEICGQLFTGVELRSLLGLRSTDFQLHPEGDMITIITKGYGHRVGMSQYGANALAESGYTWQQILQHYYPGATLSPIK